jgi:hypothetical protein
MKQINRCAKNASRAREFLREERRWLIVGIDEMRYLKRAYRRSNRRAARYEITEAL